MRKGVHMLYLYLDESGDLGFDFVNKKSRKGRNRRIHWKRSEAGLRVPHCMLALAHALRLRERFSAWQCTL